MGFAHPCFLRHLTLHELAHLEKMGISQWKMECDTRGIRTLIFLEGFFSSRHRKSRRFGWRFPTMGNVEGSKRNRQVGSVIDKYFYLLALIDGLRTDCWFRFAQHQPTIIFTEKAQRTFSFLALLRLK